jgi:hypothetical protein
MHFEIYDIATIPPQRISWSLRLFLRNRERAITTRSVSVIDEIMKHLIRTVFGDSSALHDPKLRNISAR